MNEGVPRIVVIGAGISGLAAANRLIELSEAAAKPIDLKVLEGSARPGGVIRTIQHEGFLVEGGPDNFITNKPWAIDLAKRLGLESELLETNTEHRRALVVRDGRLRPIPGGFQLMAPTRFWPFAFSRVLSLKGRIRAARERYMRATPPEDGDESLTSFVTRRFGREALDRLVGPLIGGIYTADPDLLSMRATMPRFLDMEEKYGSVIKGLKREAKRKTKGDTTSGGARYSMFVSFRRGMQSLVDALEKRIGSDRFRFSAATTAIERSDSGKPWGVALHDGTMIDADALLVAIPTPHAGSLMYEFDSELASLLGSIEYASSAVVNLAWPRRDIGHRLDAFGFVVPALEERNILAGSFSSVKYAGRAPDESVLIRAFVGGALNAKILMNDDDELIKIVRRDFNELLSVRTRPQFALVTRWPHSMPQYHVGHCALVENIEERVAAHGGLYLAGNGYDGVGIPDSIHSAERAAEKLITSLPS